jgi:spore coat protein H
MKLSLSFLLIFILVSLTGCSAPVHGQDQENPVSIGSPDESSKGEENNSETSERPENWSEETHSNEVDPDYETVFPQDEVNRIDIIISAENWDTMQADMTALVGEFGQGEGSPRGRGGNVPGNQPGNNPPAGDGDMIIQDSDDENPVWVTSTIAFEGSTWEYVGIRFKGNSSLKSAWSSGNLKLPFKLDFDQFEDDYPGIDDQRFYGFKQLTLASNFNDNSYLREKVASDVFREFEIPSAHTAFYEVYVDYGEGPAYFGLYTMVEVVEDTVIEEQFESDEGNLYKPSGTGATFAAGSFNEVSFDKETNQEEDDYSDILALFDALHAENRLMDPEAWREGLEDVFDVDTFLRWLAVNTVIENWDSYGIASHNYFLYTDPESGLITWIPWDNNHAFSGTARKETASLGLDEIGDRWPLIRFLIDDEVYQTRYNAYVQEVVETVFDPESIAETFTYYHDLIAPYALAETSEATMLDSEAAFAASLQQLIDHAIERHAAALQYLSIQ